MKTNSKAQKNSTNMIMFSSRLNRYRYLKVLFLIAFLFTTICCVDDWSVRNARVSPAYICEADNVNRVVVTWDYSGPKAKVKIKNGDNETLCESGARVGYCEFDRALSRDDKPLRVKVYKSGELMNTEEFHYEILSGPVNTEDFFGIIEWSEPFEKIIDGKKPVLDDNGNPTGEYVQITKMFRRAERVKWDLSTDWFTDRVIVESVKYKTGNARIEIEGPGITRTPFNAGQSRPGNRQHPGGDWYGYFSQSLEIDADHINVYSYVIVLTIKCKE